MPWPLNPRPCPLPCRDAERSRHEAEERKAQVSVLMETIETLQAGSSSEREQRVVTLTAQLATSKAREVALEQRAGELLVRL